MTSSIRYQDWLCMLLGLFVTGCTGMKGTTSGLRTTPSIGDRQLGVVSGRPGEEAIIRTNTASTPYDVSDTRRISGRVIDHRGQPVSGATVRLADGATSGGAVSDVMTDEAGGFTLRGLRASTPYTVIASLDIGGETRLARSRFLTGETQARLLLEPTSENMAAAKPASPRSKEPVRESVAAIEKPAAPKGRWVFVDESGDKLAELATPREDARIRRAAGESEQELIHEESSKPVAKVTRTSSGKKSVNGSWHTSDQAEARTANNRDTMVQQAQYVAGDESNPLPPALERKPFVYEEFEAEEEVQPAPRMATRGDRSIAESGPRPLPEDLVPVTEVPTAEELLNRTQGKAARDIARSRLPEKLVRNNDRLYEDAPSAGSLRVEQIEEYNRQQRAQRSRQAGQAIMDERPEVIIPKRNVTWDKVDQPTADVARTDGTINRANRSMERDFAPADLPESNEAKATNRSLERSFAKRDAIERTLNSASRNSLVAQIEPDVARTDQERIDRLKSMEKGDAAAFDPASPKSANEWMTRLTGSMTWWKKPASGSTSTESAGVYCDFDATNQRLVDFELPDVKGRPTRFGQMPANLTLLFFWGTWCKPCHETLPHLVELQRRLESDNVQIVGIAYEEGSQADRQKKVAMAADRYGINFPLLLGGKGGADACPVRKAMGVQVYPTMILVDHNGRILWRDHGSTPATLGRLDRVLASHLRELDKTNVARANRENAR